MSSFLSNRSVLAVNLLKSFITVVSRTQLFDSTPAYLKRASRLYRLNPLNFSIQKNSTSTLSHFKMPPNFLISFDSSIVLHGENINITGLNITKFCRKKLVTQWLLGLLQEHCESVQLVRYLFSFSKLLQLYNDVIHSCLEYTRTPIFSCHVDKVETKTKWLQTYELYILSLRLDVGTLFLSVDTTVAGTRII